MHKVHSIYFTLPWFKSDLRLTLKNSFTICFLLFQLLVTKDLQTIAVCSHFVLKRNFDCFVQILFAQPKYDVK